MAIVLGKGCISDSAKEAVQHEGHVTELCQGGGVMGGHLDKQKNTKKKDKVGSS